MESCYVEEHTKIHSEEPVNDNDGIRSPFYESNTFVPTIEDASRPPSSSGRPIVISDGSKLVDRTGALSESEIPISHDYESFLNEKRGDDELEVNVISLLESNDVHQHGGAVTDNECIADDKERCLEAENLPRSLSLENPPPSSCVNTFDENGAIQLGDKDTSISLANMTGNEPSYLVVMTEGNLISDESKYNHVIAVGEEKTNLENNSKSLPLPKQPGKRKSVAVEKGSGESLSKHVKIQKQDQFIDRVDQNTTFLTSATMILDQQGTPISELHPSSQIDGLYTVEVSAGAPCLSTVMSEGTMDTADKQLAYQALPSTSVSLQNAPETKGDTVNQQWFTTKDDKSSLQVKGMKWKQGMWSKDEVALLKENIESYCRLHEVEDPSQLIFCTPKDERKHFYRSIAKGISRPLFAIYRKTLRLYDNKNYIGKYSEEEVAKLEELYAKYGHDWATIGGCLGRSAASVKDRCRLLRKNKKTGRWTEEEENLLSKYVREQTNTKEGESVTSGVIWSTIAEKLGTRTEKQCRSKWLNYLNWKELGGKEWTKNDEIELIERIAEMNVQDENDLDWVKLADQWSSARSPQWLRGKWWAIKKHVADYRTMDFQGVLSYLQTTYLDALKSKIDRQAVALASTFSVNPNSVPLHTTDNLPSHVAVGTLSANCSVADETDANVLTNSQHQSIINTSTIDLTSLQGYQLQFQLASISPHQLLIPVNSSDITSNLADHFVIPVNMTPAIITSATDQTDSQASFIVQNVTHSAENVINNQRHVQLVHSTGQPTSHSGFIVQNVTSAADNVASSRPVQLTQALVQTELSIPIPTGEMSQDSLTAANMEAMNAGGMVVRLEPSSLDNLDSAHTTSHDDFEESISLISDNRPIEEANEITVTTDQCKIKDIDEYVNDNSSVKVVKVDQIATHDLDDHL